MSDTQTNPQDAGTTQPAVPPVVRSQERQVDLEQAAVRVLSDLARVEYPTRDGGTRRVDFAGSLAEVVTSVAANLDGVQELLSGRSGSWEADLVLRLVQGTAGWDGEYLPLHRTEPLRVDLDIDYVLEERTGGRWGRAWDAVQDAADARADAAYDAALAQHAGEAWVVPAGQASASLFTASTPEEIAAAEATWVALTAEREHVFGLHPDVAAAYAAADEVPRDREAAEDTYRGALLAVMNTAAVEAGYDVPVVHDSTAPSGDWFYDPGAYPDTTVGRLLAAALDAVGIPAPPPGYHEAQDDELDHAQPLHGAHEAREVTP